MSLYLSTIIESTTCLTEASKFISQRLSPIARSIFVSLSTNVSTTLRSAFVNRSVSSTHDMGSKKQVAQNKKNIRGPVGDFEFWSFGVLKFVDIIN